MGMQNIVAPVHIVQSAWEKTGVLLGLAKKMENENPNISGRAPAASKKIFPEISGNFHCGCLVGREAILVAVGLETESRGLDNLRQK